MNLTTVRRAGQKSSFAANCTCRADPESPVGKRVFVITPKAVLPTVAMRSRLAEVRLVEHVEHLEAELQPRRSRQPDVLDH